MVVGAVLSEPVSGPFSLLIGKIQENLFDISRLHPLTYLAPNIIVENILAGTQPVDLTVRRLRYVPALPHF